MLAAATFVGRALQCVSHLISKPTRHFHETVIGFSEQDPIALTAKIAHVPEFRFSQDILEDFNIEQIRLRSGGR
jgi:hypothetical protein